MGKIASYFLDDGVQNGNCDSIETGSCALATRTDIDVTSPGQTSQILSKIFGKYLTKSKVCKIVNSRQSISK